MCAAPYTLRPQVWHIAADPSAAAFFVVLGVLLPPAVQIVLPDVLADDNRLSFLRIVSDMGGKVQRNDNDIGMCELSVQGGARLRAIQISAVEIPTMIDESAYSDRVIPLRHRQDGVAWYR